MVQEFHKDFRTHLRLLARSANANTDSINGLTADGRRTTASGNGNSGNAWIRVAECVGNNGRSQARIMVSAVNEPSSRIVEIFSDESANAPDFKYSQHGASDDITAIRTTFEAANGGTAGLEIQVTSATDVIFNVAVEAERIGTTGWQAIFNLTPPTPTSTNQANYASSDGQRWVTRNAQQTFITKSLASGHAFGTGALRSFDLNNTNFISLLHDNNNGFLGTSSGDLFLNAKSRNTIVSDGTANGAYFGINKTSGSSPAGISLFNGVEIGSSGEPNFGMFFGQTSTFGTHAQGADGDFSTYLTTTPTPASRGWIFRARESANVASISNRSQMALGGENTTFHAKPWFTIRSPITGDNWSAQGAGISVGESGRRGQAAIHMTYNGDGSGYIGMGAVDDTAGTGGTPGAGHFDFTFNNHDILVGGRLFPGSSAGAKQSTRFIEDVTGEFGSIQVGGKKSGWRGYSIGGSHTFIDNGSTVCGIFDDTNNKWMVRGFDNSFVDLRFDGVMALRTQDRNISGNTSSATAFDHDGVERPIGFNNLRRINVNSSTALTSSHAGALIFSNTATVFTLFPNPDFKAGSITTVLNFGGGNINFNAISGTNIRRFTTSGSRVDGNAVIPPGSIAYIYNLDANSHFIWGSNIS